MPDDDGLIAPIVVKKYANRRLYDTESSIYITLDTLADMVRNGREFVVYDAKNGDDITRAVLTQIIMEEELCGRNMLPKAFLRHLISFYGNSVQGLVPEYLETMMEQFAFHQTQAQAAIQRTIETRVPADTEVAARTSVPMLDRTIGLSAPAHRPAMESAGCPELARDGSTQGCGDSEEVLALRAEVIRLRRDLARLDAGLAEPVLPKALADGVRH